MCDECGVTRPPWSRDDDEDLFDRADRAHDEAKERELWEND